MEITATASAAAPGVPRVTLRSLRKAARLTQVRLAELAGVRPATVSDIERGAVRSCTYATVSKLARALDTTPANVAAAIEASGKVAA